MAITPTPAAAALPDITGLTDFFKAGPGRLPAGFFVASDVWTALAAHPDVKTGSQLHKDGNMTIAPTGGIPIACDPSLKPGVVEVALTPQAFKQRLGTLPPNPKPEEST